MKVSKMGKTPRKYTYDFKLNALQLAEKVGIKEAAAKLGISIRIIYDWKCAAREGRLKASPGSQAQESATSMVEELDSLRKRVKMLEREKYVLSGENYHLRSLNDFLSASLREDGKEPPAAELLLSKTSLGD